METGGGDGSEMGSVMEEKKINDQYRCQPHPNYELTTTNYS